MGLFDSFTGGPARDAARDNTIRLQNLKDKGMRYLDNGMTGALGALDTATAAYDPLKALSTKYGGASSMLLDALGVNGADGNARAVNAFQAGPGYDWAVDQSTDAVARKANALGGIGGNALAAISDRAGNMANQEYGSWLDRLGGFVAPELSATSTAAGGLAGLGTARAGLYTNDAAQRVGLASNVTNGINSQATQSANASMAANGNLWNMGMQLANLGANAMGGGFGGSSLLGGGTGATHTPWSYSSAFPMPLR